MYRTFNPVTLTKLRKFSSSLSSRKGSSSSQTSPSSPSIQDSVRSGDVINFGFVVDENDGDGTTTTTTTTNVSAMEFSNNVADAPSHDPLYLLALFSCAILQVFSIVLYILVVYGGDAFRMEFLGAAKDAVMRNPKLWINPGKEGDNIWFMVQIFTGMWIGYGISTVFRRVDGHYLYRRPGIIPTSTYLCWMGCVATFDVLPFLAYRFTGLVILPFVVTTVVLATTAIFRTAIQFVQVKEWLRVNSTVDFKLTPALAISGPSSFAALNFFLLVSVLCRIFSDDLQLLSIPTASTVFIVIVSILVVVSFIAETLLLDAYLRSVSGHYLFLTLMLTFVYLNPHTPSDSFFHNYNLVTIVLTVILFVAKIVVAVLRNKAGERKRLRLLEREGG